MDTDAVILAGGYSSRANAFKMELDLDGKAILEHVLDAFLPICENIIVVGGFQIERLVPLVKKYDERIQLIFNEDFSRGMFTSVKKGIKEVRASQFFLTPGDYPLLTTAVCKELLKHKGQIIKPSYENKGGHPILLPASCIAEILAEEEDSTLKKYLDKKEVKVIEIKDESILMDMDTKEDYEKIKQYYEQKNKERK